MALGPRTNRLKSSAPEVRYAEVIKRLEDRIRALESKSVVIPLLDEDPDAESGVNMWAFRDGRLRVRIPTDFTTTPTTYTIIEFASVSVPGGTTNTVGSLPTMVTGPQTYRTEYTATWAQSYKEDGTQRSDIAGLLSYGKRDTTGRNRALLGFDYTTIAADLATSTVLSVTLELQMLEAPYSTTTPFFGIHNYTAAPATWAGGSIPYSQILSASLYPNTTEEIDLTVAFATMIREGTGKGIAIEAPSDSITFAGLASGYGSSYDDAVLIIEYAK